MTAGHQSHRGQRLTWRLPSCCWAEKEAASSQAEQSSVVLGEPSPAQVSASVFSRSLIKAVLLRSTAAAAEAHRQGRTS